MNGLEVVFGLTGLVLWCFAWLSLRDSENRPRHRMGSASFWFVLGAIFAFGSILPHWVTGLLVLAMVALAQKTAPDWNMANDAALDLTILSIGATGPLLLERHLQMNWSAELGVYGILIVLLNCFLLRRWFSERSGRQTSFSVSGTPGLI